MSLLQLAVEAHLLLFILSFSNVVYFYCDTLWHPHSMSYSHFNHGKLCTCKMQYKKLGMCIDVNLVSFLGQQGTSCTSDNNISASIWLKWHTCWNPMKILNLGIKIWRKLGLCIHYAHIVHTRLLIFMEYVWLTILFLIHGVNIKQGVHHNSRLEFLKQNLLFEY